jgi:hypothetical protein
MCIIMQINTLNKYDLSAKIPTEFNRCDVPTYNKSKN